MSSPPVRIDTHGAVVFLAGENVYKLKRAVKFPFMDLSTLDRRRAACDAEIAVNAINAPTIYLGAVPVNRGKEGLQLGGVGEPIDWVVHMRRFDERLTLDLVAEGDGLPPALLAKLVIAILASHARAPVRNGEIATASLHSYLQQNFEAFTESPDLFSPERVARLTERSQEMLASCWNLLIERGRRGFVRRCHGDLHLRNIVLLQGEPTLFDAVEFDDAIATGDVLYDLAFLLMDLWERGLKNEANLLLNRYLWGSGEEQLKGLAALTIFMSIRAAIRAKVIAASLPHLAGDDRQKTAEDARRYFSAAEAFLVTHEPRLVAVGGLSGSGKTTLAAAIASHLGLAPGAVHFRSDIERKALAGVGEMEQLPEAAYTQLAADAVYTSLRQKAKLTLETGYSVVVDAVHAHAAERDAIAATAREAGVSFIGLWLEAPTAVLAERVRTRAGDASDADEQVVCKQSKYDLGAIGWRRIDMAGELGEVIVKVLRSFQDPT